MNNKSYTIVGVIGHIDHGKTSLVAALTGIETDTNPEEKRRGITIDLGFASFEDHGDEFAMIDAPGHQKYIGNLLAGVSSIDVGLLVVACDQGIQAQTMEHAAILRALGVNSLVVALSRCDLANAEQMAETKSETELLLEDIQIEDYEILFTSTQTGQGLDELRSLIKKRRRSSNRQKDGGFRMPIDRVFNKDGRGTIVAGTTWSGEVQTGEELMIARNSLPVRVREIEIHGRNENRSVAGYRTAMNLAGINAHLIRRGDELITPRKFRETSRILAAITVFDHSGSIRCPSEYHLHTATTHCETRLIGSRILEPGVETEVVLHTSQPILFSYDQPFLLRRPYPVGSCAAGRFLSPLEDVESKTSIILKHAAPFKQKDPSSRFRSLIELRGELDPNEPALQAQLGLTQEELANVVQETKHEPLIVKHEQHFLSRQSVDTAKSQILKRLTKQISDADAWLSEEALSHYSNLRSTSSATKIAIAELTKEKKIVHSNGLLALRSDSTTLSKKQASALVLVLKTMEDNRTPPSLKELADLTDQPQPTLISLLRYAEQQKTIEQIDNGLYYSATMLMIFRSELISLFDEEPQRSVAEIRDHLKITRKYAIPLLEYFDSRGFTVRSGDTRQAGSNLTSITPN